MQNDGEYVEKESILRVDDDEECDAFGASPEHNSPETPTTTPHSTGANAQRHQQQSVDPPQPNGTANPSPYGLA